MTKLTKGLKKIADAVFGQDWLVALAPKFPESGESTIALTRATVGADRRGDLAEWLEVRRNDNAGPYLFVGTRPGFSFFDTNDEIGRDGSKGSIGTMSFAPGPPEGLEPGKYSVVRREARPVKTGLPYYLFRTNSPYKMIKYTAGVEKANLTLPEALAHLAQFEAARPRDAGDNGRLPEKHCSTLAPQNPPPGAEETKSPGPK